MTIKALRFSALLGVLTMLTGLFSCGKHSATAGADLFSDKNGTSAETAEVLSFDSIVKDTTLLLAHHTDTGRCSLRMSVIYAKGKHAQTLNDTLLKSDIFWKVFCDTSLQGMTMQKAIDTYTQAFIDNYRTEIGPLLRDGFGGPAATYSYDVRTILQPGRDSTVCYLASIYAYTGGAHGSAETVAMNFDLRTGHRLGLGDVLRHGYETTTNRLIEQKLLRIFKVKTLEELREMTFFYNQQVYTPDNFILGSDSITFIYMQDEIAPHAMGEIRIPVSYKELDGVLQ